MSDDDEEFERFHAALQELGSRYLRACLKVNVPPICQGHEMYAMLSMAIAACKAVGITDALILETTEVLVRGAVRLEPKGQA